MNGVVRRSRDGVPVLSRPQRSARPAPRVSASRRTFAGITKPTKSASWRRTAAGPETPHSEASAELAQTDQTHQRDPVSTVARRCSEPCAAAGAPCATATSTIPSTGRAAWPPPSGGGSGAGAHLVRFTLPRAPPVLPVLPVLPVPPVPTRRLALPCAAQVRRCAQAQPY